MAPISQVLDWKIAPLILNCSNLRTSDEQHSNMGVKYLQCNGQRLFLLVNLRRSASGSRCWTLRDVDCFDDGKFWLDDPPLTCFVSKLRVLLQMADSDWLRPNHYRVFLFTISDDPGRTMI